MKGPKKPDPKSMDWDDILKNLAINANKKLKKPSESDWNKIVNDILTMLVVWSVLFFLEQIAMLYVSIHYHYRADGIRIDESKRRRNALMTLYDASISVYAPFHTEFRAEDAIIRSAKGAGKGKFLSKFSSSNPKVIVDHALEDQRSTAALAKRIWLSLVPEGQEVMSLRDVVEVLGVHRRIEAEEAFRNLDKNENGDINLNEMVLMALETGRTRRDVYQGMTDINRAISVLDWLFRMLIMMAVVIMGSKCSLIWSFLHKSSIVLIQKQLSDIYPALPNSKMRQVLLRLVSLGVSEDRSTSLSTVLSSYSSSTPMMLGTVVRFTTWQQRTPHRLWLSESPCCSPSSDVWTTGRTCR